MTPTVLSVSIEPGIPKLLVKVHPAEALPAKNLGEVELRKDASRERRGQVAVLHVSRGVAPGKLLVSLRLAEIMDLADGERVEITCPQAEGNPSVSSTSTTRGKMPATRVSEPFFQPQDEGRFARTSFHTHQEPAAAANAAPLMEQSSHYHSPYGEEDRGGICFSWPSRNLTSSSFLPPGGSAVHLGRTPYYGSTAGQLRQTPATGLGSLGSAAAAAAVPMPSLKTFPAPSLGRLRSQASSVGALHMEQSLRSSSTSRGTMCSPATSSWRPPEGLPRTGSNMVDSLPASDGSGDEGEAIPAVGQPAFCDLRLRADSYSPRGAREASHQRDLHIDFTEPVEPRSSERADHFVNWRQDAPDCMADKAHHNRQAACWTPTLAQSLEPSPAQSCASSRASSVGSSISSPGIGSRGRQLRSQISAPPREGPAVVSDGSQWAKDGYQATSRGTSSSPETSAPSMTGRSGPASSAPTSNLSEADGFVIPQSRQPPLLGTGAPSSNLASATSSSTTIGSSIRLPPTALVPLCTVASVSSNSGATPGSATPGRATPSTRRNSVLRRRNSTLGALQPDGLELAEETDASETVFFPDPPRNSCPLHWEPPAGGGLERSELGPEATAEVRRWLLGETSGRQCSQIVLDRALTVLSNFKLASGCQLEVLGGPLGAIVGGYSNGDWLYNEVFCCPPAVAVRNAFAFLGFQERGDGDWSHIVVEEVSLVYRRLCLRGHPSRGGQSRNYLQLQVAMEIVRAFSGEAGPLVSQPSGPEGFVLDDLTLVRELKLSAKEAEEEAGKLPHDVLEDMNRALDEYILRQMCFKSEIVDEIARLHENSAYAILGVSSDATDSEIKKAYRLIAMQCHPDKGGDKEEFQELHSAYEKIMEQRRLNGDDKNAKAGNPEENGREDLSDPDEPPVTSQPQRKSQRKNQNKGRPANTSTGAPAEDETAASEDDVDSAEDDSATAAPQDTSGIAEDTFGEEDTTASMIEKARRAAEEASRYAKTAAEFAQQASQAAEAARKDREQGSRDSLTKSVAHSAIVYTLTVVKAVRAVGYATLDVAAQCRIATKRNPAAVRCGECAVTSMSLGLEALNSALSCAEVTETTAAELQAPIGEGSSTPAERFVNAAVRASLAAASASNAAMAAAISAVEGSRHCLSALDLQQEPDEGQAAGVDPHHDAEQQDQDGGCVDCDEPEFADGSVEPNKSPNRGTPSLSTAEATQAIVRRLVAQRNNNHKVLQRLNAEILAHQKSVRQFLHSNRQLIPPVSGKAKQQIFMLLQDYSREARQEFEQRASRFSSDASKVLRILAELPLMVPFLQPQGGVAIPVSVKARVVRMAALYDLPLTMRIMDEVLGTARALLLPKASGSAGNAIRQRFHELSLRLREELTNGVANDTD